MKSRTPKVVHPVAGKPMISYPLEALRQAGADQRLVILGPASADVVKKALPPGVATALQPKPLGTGHALACARPALKRFKGTLLVTAGDSPLVTGASLKSLLAFHRRGGYAASVMSARVADPSGYGRILRSRGGDLAGIVEHRDASPQQLEIREINSGIYCLEAPLLWDELASIGRSNAKGEYYLTDLLAVLRNKGYRCGVFASADPDEILGVNTRVELAQAEKLIRRRINRRLMEGGVTLVDPDSTFIDDGVVIGPDSLVQPFSFITGATRIASGCLVGPFARIHDSLLEAGCQVVQSVVENSRIGAGALVGPWSRLRPGTQVGAGAHLGNFCEFKNSKLGAKVRAGHLSYLGDATVGPEANIGAGTITANYDGKNKFPTRIGAGAFTGSGTVLVAPVEMGAKSKTGAGAIVLAGRNVPKDGVAVGMPARLLDKKRKAKRA